MPKLTSQFDFYQNYLLNDVIAFWEKHSIDRQSGGYFNCLNRQGKVYSTDKYAWMQARQVWMFAKLYNELGHNPHWLAIARSGAEFLTKHFFNSAGRMYYSVTREGKPLSAPWHLYSEVFAVIGLAEYAQAVQDDKLLNFVRDLYWRVIKYSTQPEMLGRNPDSARKMTNLSIPMVILNITQEIRTKIPDSRYPKIIDECIATINKHKN